MSLYDMPNTLTIGDDYLKEINNGNDVVSEILNFLQDHCFADLSDYEDFLGFNGFEDDNSDPIILLMNSSISGDVVTITADLQYSLKEQQNSCGDSLASILHRNRIIYTYTMNEEDITYELDTTNADDTYFPEEYGG